MGRKNTDFEKVTNACGMGEAYEFHKDEDLFINSLRPSDAYMPK